MGSEMCIRDSVWAVITFWRCISVFVLFAIVNRWRRPENRVSFGWQAVIFDGGLRGALAFIMAQEAIDGEKDPEERTRLQGFFNNTILTIIFLTVIVQGILIKPIIIWFKLTEESDGDIESSNEMATGDIESSNDMATGDIESSDEMATGEVLGEDIASTESSGSESRWKQLDSKLKKWLIKDPETRNKLNREDYTKEVRVALSDESWINKTII